MKNNSFDIFIVGMGPIGLFAANVFGNYGYKTCIIEKWESRVNFPRAINLDSEVVRAVQSVGLQDKLLKVLSPTAGLHMISHKGELLAIMNTAGRDGYSPGNLFYQPDLEDILEDGIGRFSNVEVNYGWEFVSIEESNDTGVKFTCKNTKTGETQAIESKFLLGCDGANSSVRAALGIEENNFNYEGSILKVDVTEKTNPQPFEHIEQFCSATFPFIRMSASTGHKRFEFPLINDPNAKKEVYEQPEKINELLEKVGEDTDNLTVDHVILYYYRSVIQKKWREGRVLIAGDAAHLTPPFIGQGMCAGFRDIMNVGWKIGEILDGSSSDSILETYQSEREPNFRSFLEGAFLAGDTYVSNIEALPMPLPPDKKIIWLPNLHRIQVYFCQ